jgi:hypothetical protein
MIAFVQQFKLFPQQQVIKYLARSMQTTPLFIIMEGCEDSPLPFVRVENILVRIRAPFPCRIVIPAQHSCINPVDGLAVDTKSIGQISSWITYFGRLFSGTDEMMAMD